MSRCIWLLLAILSGLGPVLAADGNDRSFSLGSQSAKRVALVIGNDNYASISRLEKAVNDARAVGEALKRNGYATTVISNGNQRQMQSAINRFVEEVGGGGEGVFFFAGHGVQVANENLLMPIDVANTETENDIRDQGISLQAIQEKLGGVRPKFVLLVVDACRDNPLPRRGTGRSLGGARGLELKREAPEGQMVLFSAGTNQKALDGKGPADRNPNSVFTREFLPYLNNPNIEIHAAIQQLRVAVRDSAAQFNGHAQMPAVYDEAIGQFYFGSRSDRSVGPNPAPGPSNPVPTPKPPAPMQSSDATRWALNRDNRKLTNLALEAANMCLESNKPTARNNGLSSSASLMAPCGPYSGQDWHLLPRGRQGDRLLFQLQSEFVRQEALCLLGSRADSLWSGGGSFMTACGDLIGQQWNLVEGVQPGYFMLRFQGADGMETCLTGPDPNSAYLRGRVHAAACDRRLATQLWKLK